MEQLRTEPAERGSQFQDLRSLVERIQERQRSPEHYDLLPHDWEHLPVSWGEPDQYAWREAAATVSLAARLSRKPSMATLPPVNLSHDLALESPADLNRYLCPHAMGTDTKRMPK